MQFEAQKRGKNNIVHVFDGQKKRQTFLQGTVDMSVCGSARLNDKRDTYDVERDEVLGEEYLIVDGNIVGKFCGNCSTSLTSPKFEP